MPASVGPDVAFGNVVASCFAKGVAGGGVYPMTFGRVKMIKIDDMTFRGLVRLVRLERKRRSANVPAPKITGQIIAR